MAALSTYLFWLPLDGGDDFALIPLGHGVIDIDGNADFAATALLRGWPGDGSPENPYLIDGLDIDRGGTAGHCIYIKNTRASFIMRDCRFTGADVSPGEGSGMSYGEMIAESGAGILLYNVANGELVNNTCNNNNNNGIFLLYSRLNTVANNTCNNNGWDGIYLETSDSNTVVNNTCTSNGWEGIGIAGEYNIAANNNCTSNGREFHRDGGGICIGGAYNTVTNNTCTSNDWYGIFIVGDSTTVANNTCTNNGRYGIFISGDSNTVVNNTCNYNRIGIYLRNSTSNTVINNTFLGNTEHDILEESGTEEIPPDIFSCSDSQELHFWVQDVNW
jgi:parallel beta-helix repeat protein